MLWNERSAVAGSHNHYLQTVHGAFSQNTGTVLALLVKVVLLCILFLSVVEGVYYWSFAKPAYSLLELEEGYRHLLNVAADHPKVSEVRSPTTRKTSPLSSLPSLSGVDWQEAAQNDEEQPSSDDEL